ncbi:MAG: hypothetical protein F6J98_43370 [Moorea sp. SIO4G2]|nr:hypothetical protein [Moorena sp. SIO4G2]
MQRGLGGFPHERLHQDTNIIVGQGKLFKLNTISDSVVNPSKKIDRTWILFMESSYATGALMI